MRIPWAGWTAPGHGDRAVPVPPPASALQGRYLARVGWINCAPTASAL